MSAGQLNALSLEGRAPLFDTIFTRKTRFQALNQTLERTARNKSGLLLVWEQPDIPLHTNGSETDIHYWDSTV